MDLNRKQSSLEGGNISDDTVNQVLNLFSSLLLIGILLVFLIILFDKGAVMVAESMI